MEDSRLDKPGQEYSLCAGERESIQYKYCCCSALQAIPTLAAAAAASLSHTLLFPIFLSPTTTTIISSTISSSARRMDSVRSTLGRGIKRESGYEDDIHPSSSSPPIVVEPSNPSFMPGVNPEEASSSTEQPTVSPPHLIINPIQNINVPGLDLSGPLKPKVHKDLDWHSKLYHREGSHHYCNVWTCKKSKFLGCKNLKAIKQHVKAAHTGQQFFCCTLCKGGFPLKEPFYIPSHRLAEHLMSKHPGTELKGIAYYQFSF